MKCEEARNALGAVLDAEATATVQGAVEVHLAGCAPCRAERAALSDLKARVAAMPVPTLPEDFTARTVRRALAAVERRRRGGAWAARFRAAVSQAVGFLLGAARPAPVGLAPVWRGALALGLCSASLSILSAFVLVGTLIHLTWHSYPALLPRAMYEASQRLPELLPLEQMSAGTVAALIASPMLVLFLVSLRGLRSGAFLADLRHARPLPAQAVVPFFVGLFAVTLFAALGVIVATVPLDLDTWRRFTPLAARIPVLAVCASALAVLCLRSLRGTFPLAIAFYGTLFAAWVGHRAIGYVGSAVANLGDEVPATIFLRVASADYVWRVVATFAGAAGLLVGLTVVMCAWRPEASRAARLRNVLVPGSAMALILLGVVAGYGEHMNDRLRNDYHLGGSLSGAAGLSNDAASPTRSAIILWAGGRVPMVVSFRLPNLLAPANVERVEAFLRRSPSSFLAPEAHRVLMSDALYRWDADAHAARLLRFIESGAGSSFTASGVAYELERIPSAAAYRPMVSAFADQRRFLPSDDRARNQLAKLLVHYGNDRLAGTLLRQVAPESRGAAKHPAWGPPRMRDGALSGRIVLNGEPLANAQVRLFSTFQSYYWGTPPEEASEFLNAIQSQLKSESVEVARRLSTPSGYWARQPFVAVRTDAEGRFELHGLVDGDYALAVLLGSNVEGWEVLVDHAPGRVRLSPERRRVDVGSVHLRVTPR